MKPNEEKSALLIKNVRTPYIDSEKFPQGARLRYTLVLERNGAEKEYSVEAKL